MSVDPQSPQTGSAKEIFLEAIEIENLSKRAGYVSLACRGNEELLRKVNELLKEEQEVGDFLQNPACGRAAPAYVGPKGTEMSAEVTERPGERIGRYKLLQTIGEGGCGIVYMAEQEEPVRRRVALKIIKLGMDTRKVIARFEAERQALAMMDHPNIARVLDAGATTTGRPYFVMELVRGIKITDYCDQNNVPTDERLELFIQVCHAIQHAHQKGIIHRDIKPSNVLVTLHDGTPVPKVIDFGVAKATNQQRLTDKTVFTAFEQFIGTPAYMSPEQAEMSGLDIDTRSDVYSLGVLLYELLTGKTPFDPETLVKNGIDECRRTIRHDEPARPSGRLADLHEPELTTTADRRRTRGQELIHLLRGDLDWIVMKCLEKDRTRRYETVNALAQDVRRHLQRETVVARPPSSLYKFHKFAQRHRTPLAVSCAIGLLLTAAAGLSSWLALRAVRAERNATTAHQQESLLRREAENGWDRARVQAARARLNEYIAEVNLAQQSLISGNYGRAVQLLEKHKPQPGQTDIRGFEWRYLWLVSCGDNHLPLPAQDGAVRDLAFSPDGELLVTALRDHLKVWNTRTRAELADIPAGASSVLFSPDGATLYTAGQGHIRSWNTANWSKQHEQRDGSGVIALSPNGKLLASGSREEIRLTDTDSWTVTKSFPGASGPVAFSSDGTLLLTDSEKGLTVWPLAGDGTPVILEEATNICSKMPHWLRGSRLVAFSPDNRHVVAARNTASPQGLFVISIWDARSGQLVGAMPEDPALLEHTGTIMSLEFSRDGRTLATASTDHSIRLWDLASRRRKATLQGHLSEVWCIAFAPDGETIASGGKDGGIKLWPAQSPVKQDALPRSWQPLGFSEDGRTLAVFEHPEAVLLVNPPSLEPVQRFPLEPARFRPSWSSRVAVSQDLKTLAEGMDDGRVRLWNIQTHETVFMKASDGPVGLVALSGSGRELITGGFGQPSRWWNLVAGTNYVLETEVQRALFSPDDRTVALFSRNNSVQLWDVPTHALRQNLANDVMPGFAAAFSSDGKIFATSSSPADVEPEIQLWDTFTGKKLGTCVGHKQNVYAVAFAPDGKTLASSSDDSTIRFWNVATCQELMSIRRLGDPPSRLIFSPDGRTLVSSTVAKIPLLSEIDQKRRD